MNFIPTSFAVHRFTDKLVRRARRMAGRPDNTPWILDGRRLPSAQVDFLFALDYLSPNSRLVRFFHEAMSAYGLSLLLVNSSNLEKITRQLSRGLLRPAVYLDLSSRPGDAFENLLYTAAARGVHALRHPDHTRWVLKALAHPHLESAGLPLPPTVIFRAADPDRDLTPDERKRLGDRCVIKPSFGEAAKGVVVGIEPTKENIAAARDYSRAFDWLVQRQISWTSFGQRPAYLRAYHLAGHRTLLWWCKDKGREGYHLLSWDDLARYDLLPALDLLDRLARVTAMDFFSTEIAITGESGADRFCLIDYVNDQCDLDPDAHPEYSPPPEFARWACHALAELTWRKKHHLPAPPHQSLCLSSVSSQ